MAKIVIIDDDDGICKVISRMAAMGGHDIIPALTFKQGLEAVQSSTPDVVFLDVHLPDGNGLKMIPIIKAMSFSPEVIIITGLGDPDGAETAIRLGAWDYLLKPLSIHQLSLTLKRTLQYRKASTQEQVAPVSVNLGGVESTSPLMKDCLKALSQAAKGDVSVFITGETGTGKDFYARVLHGISPRAGKNFVVADCAALPGSLVESLLFGSEKGAYTDAKQSKPGLIAQADEGTLFLDEIGELPFVNQKAFLHVLDTKRFRPLGGRQEIKSDFRLISATNKNLHDLVEKGLFRKDLFYRLHSFSIVLPPLRERIEDIQPLALYCMSQVCKRMQLEPKAFSSDFFDFCSCYGWPGNIRELFNTIETIIFQAPDEAVLFPKHLPEHIRIKVARASADPSEKCRPELVQTEETVGTSGVPSFRDFRTITLEGAEKKYFLSLMAVTKGNIKAACQVSGLSRSSVYSFLKKHHISRIGWASF